MLLAVTGFANPQLDLRNPTDFFTDVASRFLADLNVNLTNIQIYPTNQYTPAVHRLLQLTANLYDATTNRFIGGGPTNYPTVFRPIFNSENGIVSIVGYQEVTDDVPALNFQYWNAARAATNTGTLAGINIYGVPWIIGAKKGFPNFNEFTMDNTLTVSRDVEFTNAVAARPWTTNQIYNLDITNSFGLEAWNSYTNAYSRALLLVASNQLSIIITNEFGLSLLQVTNLAFGIETNFTGWPGWSEHLSDNSFKVPLFVSNNFTNGIYLRNDTFHPLNPPSWDATFQPHFWMSLQFKFQFILIDTSVNPHRVIDFANLISTQPPIDIPAMLDNAANGFEVATDPDAPWDTNFLNRLTGSGPLKGIITQMQIGSGQVSVPDYVDTTGRSVVFYDRIYNDRDDTNSFECPYSPHRTIHQIVSWQANDPLVHYTVPDLTSTNGFAGQMNVVTIFPARPAFTNMAALNFAYQPWGGYHLPGQAPINQNFGQPNFNFDARVKDPGVQQSDNWDFPSGEPLSFEWLGRVHRGTPWQTVFLKPSNQTVAQWLTWNNDNVIITNAIDNYSYNYVFDAGFSHPTNDWRIASLWARWLNTNDLSTLLSISNPDTNAWAARLDGLTALTNNPTSGELNPITISSNSLQAEIIAQGVQAARANTVATNAPIFLNHIFHDVGDVLATPQLSVVSPFLNTNSLSTPGASGITDEAMEKIPTQLLPLLRTDSFGQIQPANGQLKMSFSGYDGHAYAIEASSNLTDWVVISTNSPTDGTFGITNPATSGQQFYRTVVLH